MLWATEELGPGRLELKYPYFEAAPTRFEEPLTYTDGDALAEPVTYQWNHGLGEIVQAVIDIGPHGHAPRRARRARLARLPLVRGLRSRPLEAARRPIARPALLHPRGAPDLTFPARFGRRGSRPQTRMAGRMHCRYHLQVLRAAAFDIRVSTGTARKH